MNVLMNALRLVSGRSRGLQYGACLRVLLAACVVCLAGASSASAAPKKHSKAAAPAAPALPSAVLLATSGSDSNSSALDSIIQAELEEMHVVNVISRPGMDLSAVLLALDCVSETAQCLRAVTSQNSSDVLIAPNIARTAGETVLSILRFDNGDGQQKRVLRRQPGSTLNSSTLDAVPNMLRELFGMPPKDPPPQAAVAALPPPDDGIGIGSTEPALGSYPDHVRKGSSVPVGPIILGAGGLLLLGTATGFAISVSSLKSEYDTAHQQRTASSIDHAEDDLRSTGETNATIATVLYSVGGAVLGAAGIWFAVQMMDKSRDKKASEPGPTDGMGSGLSLLPVVSPNQVGFVLTQRGIGL